MLDGPERLHHDYGSVAHTRSRQCLCLTVSLSTERYKSSPLAGVQRAASPEGVSDETPDTPPPSGHTDAELLLAAAAVIEMDGADMLTELAADLRKRAADLTSDKGIKLT